jgi:predicted deacylase
MSHLKKINSVLSLNLILVLVILLFYVTRTCFADTSSEAATEDSKVAEEKPETTSIAPNMDLKKVTHLPKPSSEPSSFTDAKVDSSNESKDDKKDQAKSKKVKETPSPKIKKQTDAKPSKKKVARKKLIILGSEVPPNSSTRLAWSPQISISGLALPTPVLVIHGAKPGPTVCLTGAIHGDELNGIEVVRRIMYDIKPRKLSGTLIGVPIVNLQGFQRSSRYLSDRRDLNRFFPGEPNGSLASRIAHSLFTKVIKHCDYLIDLHTGSFRRDNLPQIRADMSDPKVAEFAGYFDKIAIVHNAGSPGMLRSVANESGIAAVTMELGESLRIQENHIEAGTYSINSMLSKLKMYSRTFIWGDPTPAYYESLWLRAESGGILFSEMDIGDRVVKGNVLGVVTDPITNHSSELVSPVNGKIIGMAVNQVVIPGFAAYHIGIESTQEAMSNVEKGDVPSDVYTDGEVIDPE